MVQKLLYGRLLKIITCIRYITFVHAFTVFKSVDSCWYIIDVKIVKNRINKSEGRCQTQYPSAAVDTALAYRARDVGYGTQPT